MSKQVIVITPEGSITQMEMGKDGQSEYDFLNKTVAGWIQAVDLDGTLAGFTIWVNEEGKMSGLPYNDLATLLWEISYGQTDIMVGTAVITGNADEEGDTLGLTPEQASKIFTLIG